MSGLVILDGYNSALIGQFEGRSVYSLSRIWKILQEDEMTYEEAKEYCSYNIEGSFANGNGPIFVEPLEIV